MARSTLRIALASGLATLVVACSLVISLDDLRGDASTTEAGLDGSEGGSEGGQDDGAADVICSAFCGCGTNHGLCQDFDGDGGLKGPFDTITIYGDASSSLDTTRFVSSPNSGTFKYALSSTSYQANALTYTVTSAASSMVAEAKIFVPARPSARSFETIDINFPNYYEVDWVINSTNETLTIGCYAPCQAQFDSGSPYANYSPILILPVGKWADVKLTVTLTPEFGVTLTYDGAPAYTLPKGLYTSPPAQPTLNVGAAFSSGDAGPFEIGIDDITFDWNP